MSRRLRGFVRPGAVLAALLTLLALSFPVAAETERELKEQELNRLRERIGQLKTELERDRGRYDGLRTELRQVERRLGTSIRKLRELEAALVTSAERLSELEVEQAGLQQSVGTQRERLGAQVRAAYAAGRQEYLKILLNQEDPAAVGRMLTYYDYLNRARSERIEALLETLARLASVQKAITAETRQLTDLKDREAREQRTLQATRADRQKLMERLKREIAGKDKELGRMVANERELEALVQALAEALADIPAEAGNFQPFGELQGRLAWPAEGRLLAGYGSPRSGSLSWRGVLIEGKEGQEVRAVSHGRVAFADWLRGYGLLLIIDHDDGYMSLYGHNQALYKEVGDWVAAGETVAAVGASGGNDQAALYFEIRKDGQPTDPVRWCKR